MGKEEQKKLLIETMEADEKDGLYKTNNMAQQTDNGEGGEWFEFHVTNKDIVLICAVTFIACILIITLITFI